MKHLTTLLTALVTGLVMLAGSFAHADLLDKVKLEESLRTRVEAVYKAYDPKGQVFLTFQYKHIDMELPGTSLNSGSFNPTHIEQNDIERVQIQVITELDSIPADAKKVMTSLVPLNPNQINFAYLKQAQSLVKEEKKADVPHLTPDSLSAIAHESTDSFMKIFALLTVVAVTVISGTSFFAQRRVMSEFKEQMTSLTRTLSEASFGGQQQQAHIPQVMAPQQQTQALLTSDSGFWEHMPARTLKELFGDAYWCEKDAYAAWMWKKITNEQRQGLLRELPYLKDYCNSFLNIDASELQYHEHPFYIEPSDLNHVSQEDVSNAVRLNSSVWHLLSPMRQQFLPLAIEDKIHGMQSHVTKSVPLRLSASKLRQMSTGAAWETLSVDDESTVFANPNIVPFPMRNSVKSLVWLAGKEPAAIADVLSRFDARALASAWVGPTEVLEKLEECLPDKKLKLLETYRTKTPATRTSPAFLSLVEEGLKDEAA